MKEILASNTITKYLAGLANKKEQMAFEVWLKKNPQYAGTVNVLKQRVDAATVSNLMIA